MLGGHGVDQLLDQHGLAHAGAAEQAHLAAFCVRGQQVDDLDAGFQNLHHGALVGKGGGLPVNGPGLPGDGALVVNGLAEHAEQPAQTLPAHRHGDAAAGGLHGQIPGQALRRGQEDAPDDAVPQMLGDLHDHIPAVGLGIQCVPDPGQLASRKGHIHHRTQYLHNGSSHSIIPLINYIFQLKCLAEFAPAGANKIQSVFSPASPVKKHFSAASVRA